jgi:hypothetical protein
VSRLCMMSFQNAEICKIRSLIRYRSARLVWLCQENFFHLFKRAESKILCKIGADELNRDGARLFESKSRRGY